MLTATVVNADESASQNLNLKKDHEYILSSVEVYNYFVLTSKKHPEFLKTYSHSDSTTESIGAGAHKHTILNSTQIVELNYSQTDKPYYFILFGEHARELVSADLSVRLTQWLVYCLENQLPHYLLDNFRLVLIPNLNVSGRQMVEHGNYAQRNNKNDIDLNRNYSYNYKNESRFKTKAQSKVPFSEFETRSVRYVMSTYKPKIFLSVHSGCFSVMTAPAYRYPAADETRYNFLNKVSKKVAQDRCECRNGSVSTALHYLSPGSNIDYAIDVQNIRYSYAVEIYGALDEDLNAKEYFLRGYSYFKEKYAAGFDANWGRMLHEFKHADLASQPVNLEYTEGSGMFYEFNPADSFGYYMTMSNWSHVITQIAQETNELEQKLAS